MQFGPRGETALFSHTSDIVIYIFVMLRSIVVRWTIMFDSFPLQAEDLLESL